MELQTSAQLLAAPAPAVLYQGVDTVSGVGLSTAIQGTEATHGGNSQVAYRITSDASSLYESLGISQSLAVGFGPFGSVSEKVDFVRQLSLSTYSVCIVVHATHVQGITSTTDFALNPNLAPPQSTEQMQDFFRAYGDSFVSAVTRGAEYYAVYTYYAQTRSEREAVTTELKANGIFEGGTVDASFQSKLDRVTKNTNVRIAFSQNVSGLANPKLPNPDQLVQYAIDFPSIPIDPQAAAILSYQTTGYERVRGFGTFKPVSSNRNFLIGENGQGGLADSLVKVQNIINQIAAIKQIYQTYQGFDDEKLNLVQRDAKDNLDALNAQFRRYADDPTATLTTPALPSLQFGTPALSYEMIEGSLHGRDGGGSPFNDVDVNSFLQKQTRISALQLYSGQYVDALVVTYVNNSDGSKTLHHGGTGGHVGHQLQLMPDQVVTAWSGKTGKYVDRLSLTITRGNSISGGGDGGTDAFAETPPDNTVFVGFRGRSGKYLDQIGAVYARLKPATWQV